MIRARVVFPNYQQLDSPIPLRGKLVVGVNSWPCDPVAYRALTKKRLSKGWRRHVRRVKARKS